MKTATLRKEIISEVVRKTLLSAGFASDHKSEPQTVTLTVSVAIQGHVRVTDDGERFIFEGE